MQSIQEEWRPVVGFEGYEVSNLGRVRCTDTHPRLHRRGTEVPATGAREYLRVILRRDGKSVSKRLHRLVAKAFIPNPQGRPIVRHLNHDPHDNRAVNLAWGWPRENTLDSVRDGRHAHGERHGKAVLTDELVRSIRADARPVAEVAAEHGVSVSLIYGVKRYTSWTHVPPSVDDVQVTNAGESNGRAKLTPDEVRAIRADTRPQKEIAADYGIRVPQVSRIKSYQSWGHLP